MAQAPMVTTTTIITLTWMFITIPQEVITIGMKVVRGVTAEICHPITLSMQKIGSLSRAIPGNPGQKTMRRAARGTVRAVQVVDTTQVIRAGATVRVAGSIIDRAESANPS